MSNRNKNNYSFFHLLFDVFMVIITGGLWMVWVIVRFLGRNS